MEKRVIIIVGPTCSGKTKLGIELAKELRTEIISADSRQVYKHISIGTAKPSSEELNHVKHHFIDLLDPADDYNVGLFENDALAVIKNLSNQNCVPLVVGGSGLYIKAIVDGIVDIDSAEELREELKIMRDEYGNEHIYKLLKEKDPKAAESMLPQNWKRVIRAIEVYELTGKSILDIHEEQKRESEYEFLQFGLKWRRDILYKNIENRVDEMIDAGLVKEVKKILEMGYSSNINALNTVGYKEIISFLENEISLERAIELIKRNTRRFAKRQLTWFRKDERITWFDVDSEDDLFSTRDKILASL